MLMFTCHLLLTTSSLPWLMDPNVPRLCVVWFFTPLDFAFTCRYIYTEHRFCLGSAALFLLDLSESALHSSPVAYCLPIWESHLLGSLFFLPFHTINGVLMARILEWFAIPPSVDHVLSEHFSLWPIHLGWPWQYGSQLHSVTRAPLPWQGCDPWMGSTAIAAERVENPKLKRIFI